MRPSFRGVGVLLALAGVSLAAAVELGAGQVDPSPGGRVTLADGVAQRSIDVTGSIGAAVPARLLPLSDEERGRIFEGIMAIRGVGEARVPWTATAMPIGVALHDLPLGVTREIPLVQGYKFVKLDDRILLVSPLDRSVVAMMPRYKLILD
jgi:hypothetical protein